MHRFVSAALVFAAGFACVAPAAAQDKPIKILLIAKERDHAFSQHEYLSDCSILAKCLRQNKRRRSRGVERLAARP